MQNMFIGEGNIGTSAALKYAKVKNSRTGNMDEKPVLEMSVRFPVQKKIDDEYVDSKGFWAKVSWWGKRAEMSAKFLKRGARVLIVGEQSQESYIAEKGERAGQTIEVIGVEAKNVAIVPFCLESVEYAQTRSRSEDESKRDISDTVAS